jgi:hypothetical protein
MSATALIAEARAAGVHLSLNGRDRITWACADDPPPDLLARIKAAKADVLDALASEEAPSPWFDPAGPLARDPTRVPPADADRADAIAERAAIAEIDGGLPRDWAERLAELAHGPRPAGITEREWSARLEALWVFADRHAAALDAAGWGFGEVFGVGEAWQRLDQRGAAWFALSATALQVAPDCLRWRTADGVARALWRRGCGPHVQGAEVPKSGADLYDKF